MTTRSAIVLTVVAVCSGSLALAQPADPPLVNWTAPPYWTPPAGQHVARPQAPSAQASSTERDVSVETTPETPLTGTLPFVAVTPCRLVDTRHAPHKDVLQPGGGTPAGYPRGTYANGEIRSYDLTSSTDCTGLPAGVGAWSLQFQFITASQAAYLEAWPYVTSGGIGGQTAPASESTMLGYTDRWMANSAIIPAGDDADGSINVKVQYAGDVIIEVNGYYGPEGVVTSLTSGATTLTGDVTLGAGSNVTITPSGNTLTIASGGAGGTLPTGTAGQTLRHDNSAWTASSALTNDGTNVGVSGNMSLPNTTATTGQINFGGNPFLHNYAGPGSDGGNTFVGQGAGNFTMTWSSHIWEGSYNTASGYQSLRHNTTGFYNTASGASSLFANTTGDDNTASGYGSLESNNTGYGNTANGAGSMYSNTKGHHNTANGATSLSVNTEGNDNTTSGYGSLQSDTGSSNIAVGFQAGYNLTTGDYNIDIGNQGVAAEGNTIRIGDSHQTNTYVAGIWGVSISNASMVVIDSTGHLGVQSFTSPADVLHDAMGKPETVANHELSAMLLNELQKQQAQIGDQAKTIQAQQAQIDVLLARLAAIEARMAPR